MSRPRNTMTSADGACQGRSRSEEEAMQGHRRRRETPEIVRNLYQPEGWRRDDIDFFVAPPPRCTLVSRRRCFATSTSSGSPQMLWYSWDETLALYYYIESTRRRFRWQGTCHRLEDQTRPPARAAFLCARERWDGTARPKCSHWR